MPLKYSACHKMEALLAELRTEISSTIVPAVPAVLYQNGGKISRGENYHTYAYRVLDYPAIFQKEDIFTFRTLVLWGHHIGFHLLMTGTFKEHYQARVVAAGDRLQGEFWLSKEEIPWQWFRDETEQLSWKDVPAETLQATVAARKFLKVSTYLPLTDYAAIPARGAALWKQWQSILFEE